MDLFANGFDLVLILDMLRRRVWVALTLFSLIITATVGLVIFLPNIYTANALILVEGQQIPEKFVSSTVVMGIERRLQIISQEILSRASLAQLVKQFDLYPDRTQQNAPDEIVAAKMRQDIGIEIKGRSRGLGADTVAFQVSYTHPDPQKAMEVSNKLASFYIEGNLKVRKSQALETSEFLRNELEEVKHKLEEQERRVTQYKQQHLGELPEQLDANFSTLGLLQKQMEILSRELEQARERRNVLVQMGEMETALASLDFGTSEPAGDAQLGALQSQLAELRIRFSDKHPDVVRIQQQIAKLEEEQPQIQSENAFGGDLDFASEELDFSEPVAVSSNQLEVAAVDAEIQRLTADLNKVRSDIGIYQQRIENTAKREQELVSLTRNYDTTRDLYTSLLKRLDEAKMANSLEKEQKAERFRLLEPAAYPRVPAAPKRARFFLIGLVLSLGAAAGGVLLWEILDTSFHRVDDLKAFSTVPVLVTVPRITTAADMLLSRRQQFLRAVALALSVLVLFSASYRIVAGNEQLSRAFVRPASGSQLR